MTVSNFYKIRKLLKTQSRLRSPDYLIGSIDNDEFMAHLANDTDPRELFKEIYLNEPLYTVEMAYQKLPKYYKGFSWTPEGILELANIHDLRG